MATAWFDGDNLTITPPVGDSTIDGQIELYSDWKEWVKLANNARYPAAFDTTGGDPISATVSIAGYYFLRNDLGWRLSAPAGDSTVVVVGNVLPRDPDIGFIVDPGGTHLHTWSFQVSPQALTVNTGGGALTQQNVRDAMELDSTSGQASVDTKLNNNFAVSAAAL